MKNKILVIMSVYRNDKLAYLKETLDSLYNQTYSNFDIFIQCDGILPYELENFLDKEYENNKISLLNKRDDNKGLAYSLNELILIGYKNEYEYFVRMDADDISVLNRIEKQFLFMNKNKSIDICGGFIEEFNMDTNEKQIVSYFEENKDILYGMKRRNPIAHVTTFIRKSFFDKVGLYDPLKMNEDLDLWIRGFEKKCQFYNLQKVMVRVRTNNDFFNRRKNIKRAIEVMNLKFKATRLFNFGLKGHIYAVAHFILFMLPGNLKQFIYRKMRK